MSALSEYRVLELSQGVCGEYTAKLLADFGADVIKIEPLGCGSPTRHMGPFAESVAADQQEASGLFAYLNTNKRSVAFDLDSDAGRATVARLLDKVDVVVTDFPAARLAALGLDPEQCRAQYPALVLCVITPFGLQAGEVPATDLTVFQSSGWGFHTPSAPDLRKPPLKGAGRFMASYESALDAALCVVAALYEREDSGEGEVIDISMQAVLVSRTDYVMGQMVAGDMPVTTDRTAFDLAGPASIFPCADGFVYIWMSAPTHWKALGELLAHPLWMNDFPADWLEKGCTQERVELVRGHIGDWLADKGKVAVSEAAQKLGLITVPVNNAGDLQACPQFTHRHFFAEVAHPVLGTRRYPTVPYQLSETPAAITRAAPLLGEHNVELLQGAQP